MFRLLAATGLVWLAGCSGGPPPIEIVRQPETPKPAWVEPDKPKMSDAAAKALLADMLAAHSGGKPERIAALKAIAFERKGFARSPGGEMIPVSWQGKLDGPRKYHVALQIGGPQGQTGMQVFNDGRGAYSPVSGAFAPMTPSNLNDVALQIGEEACAYLFGLADPALVAKTATVPNEGKRAMLGLHVWSPTIKHALLHIDAEKKFIARIRYMGSEAGQEKLKDLIVTDLPREVNGLFVPEKYTVTADGVYLFNWDSLSFDTGGKIDPKTFEVP